MIKILPALRGQPFDPGFRKNHCWHALSIPWFLERNLLRLWPMESQSQASGDLHTRTIHTKVNIFEKWKWSRPVYQLFYWTASWSSSSAEILQWSTSNGCNFFLKDLSGRGSTRSPIANGQLRLCTTRVAQYLWNIVPKLS